MLKNNSVNKGNMGGYFSYPSLSSFPHVKASIVSKGKFMFVKEGTAVQNKIWKIEK
jgi:hypothetical protein